MDYESHIITTMTYRVKLHVFPTDKFKFLILFLNLCIIFGLLMFAVFFFVFFFGGGGGVFFVPGYVILKNMDFILRRLGLPFCQINTLTLR